ncbi:MAG: hypothetical protein ACRDUA_01605 [Micromonosporaceae bacterium]
MSTDKTTNRTYPKPVYAAAGAGEMAVEQLKKLPVAATKLRTRVESELKKIDLADVRGKVQHEVNELPGKARTEFVSISDKVRTEVTQLRGRIADARRKGAAEVRTDADKLRSRSTDAVSEFLDVAQKQFKAASKQAVQVYEGLASRGKHVITGNGPVAVAPVAEPKSSNAPKATATKAQSKPARTTKTTRSTKASAK